MRAAARARDGRAHQLALRIPSRGTRGVRSWTPALDSALTFEVMQCSGAPSRRSRFSSSPRALFALSLVLAAGCADGGPETAGSASEPVVYGSDDREDVFGFADQTWAAQAADFSAALVSPGDLDQSDPDDVLLRAATLEERGICADERFAEEITAGFCSGTLIAPDLMLTAGHCIDADSWMTPPLSSTST